MSRLFHTPIQEFKEFDRAGYHCKMICSKNNFYLISMAKEGKVKEYEIWRGKRAKQPDGTEVFIKPSDGDFGSYGWAVSRVAVERILKALKDKFPDFPYDEFKACML